MGLTWELHSPLGSHKEQFLHIKHDVLGLVKLKYESAFRHNKKEIVKIRNKQQDEFDEIEKWIDKIHRITIYYRYDEDGNLRRFSSVAETILQ